MNASPPVYQAEPPVLYGGLRAEQRVAAKYTAALIATRLFPTRTARVRKFDYFALEVIMVHLFELGAQWERGRTYMPPGERL